MLKVAKVSLLLAAVGLSGLLASSASAANWHTNGVKAFSSTAAGASRMILHNTPEGTVLVECPATSLSGTVNGPTSAALPWLSAATVTLAFGAAGSCTINGVPGYTVVCSSAEFLASSYAGGDTLATAGGGVTTGGLTGIDCRLMFGPIFCTTITGGVPAHYINPNPIGTGAGRFTITPSGQPLTAAKIGAGCAAVPHGAVTLGSPSGLTGIKDLTYAVDGPLAPYFYRGT